MAGFLWTLGVCIVLGLIFRGTGLKRNRSEGHIGGVCAGIAESIGVEPFWIRVAFLLSMIFYGIGVMPYVVLWIALENEI